MIASSAFSSGGAISIPICIFGWCSESVEEDEGGQPDRFDPELEAKTTLEGIIYNTLRQERDTLLRLWYPNAQTQRRISTLNALLELIGDLININRQKRQEDGLVRRACRDKEINYLLALAKDGVSAQVRYAYHAQDCFRYFLNVDRDVLQRQLQRLRSKRQQIIDECDSEDMDLTEIGAQIN